MGYLVLATVLGMVTMEAESDTPSNELRVPTTRGLEALVLLILLLLFKPEFVAANSPIKCI